MYRERGREREMLCVSPVSILLLIVSCLFRLCPNFAGPAWRGGQRAFGIHYRGVQWEGGAVDRGSVMKSTSI